MAAHEVVGHVVEQSSLFLAPCPFAADVVEEHAERAHANFVHAFALVNDGQTVFQVPLDVAARVHRPHKLHMVLPCSPDKFFHAGGFICRVGLAPVAAVVGVVFGSIHKHVHLLFAHEVEQSQTVGVCIGVSIISFYNPSLRHLRRVHLFGGLQFVVLQQLQQGLNTIEGACVVAPGHHNLFR